MIEAKRSRRQIFGGGGLSGRPYGHVPKILSSNPAGILKSTWLLSLFELQGLMMEL